MWHLTGQVVCGFETVRLAKCNTGNYGVVPELFVFGGNRAD